MRCSGTSPVLPNSRQILTSGSTLVLASSRELAYGIYRRLPGLGLRVVDNAKSLGGAISSGRWRNAAILAKRLEGFKVRKTRFQKLRRMIGARRRAIAIVLRTGAAAALVYGQANWCVVLHATVAAVCSGSSICAWCGILKVI